MKLKWYLQGGCINSCDPLTFHLAPSSGQTVGLSSVLHLNENFKNSIAISLRCHLCFELISKCYTDTLNVLPCEYPHRAASMADGS